MTKVAVALSGGIDSSVAALMLLQQGFEVIGISAQTTANESSLSVINNARAVAQKLGIPFYSLDVTGVFKEKVIKYFESSYQNGETPNPCIMCNKYMKWGELFDYALNNLNADFIATGHYAKINHENGIFKLMPAADVHKDQLYFLFLLDQMHLKHTLFPLSGYTKDEVRKLAYGNDLPSKSSKESQDICFIQGKSTAKKYLNEIFGIKKGDFVEAATGKKIGEHNGFWQYTIGQRKGIGIASSEALYVTGTDAFTNTVFVGRKEELFKSELKLKHVFWSYPFEKKNFEANVKIRYNMNSVPALVEFSPEFVVIKFNEPVSAIAKGQACVLYDKNDGHLIGGSFI